MRALPLLVATVLLASCVSNSPGKPLSKSAEPVEQEPGEVIATVRFLEVEGGCWALDTPQGRVQPLSLPLSFQIDGMRVKVTLRDAPEMVSMCQIGPLREVISISAE